MKNQKNIKMDCEICGGKGHLLRFAHVENGMCYACDGKGYYLLTEEQAKKVEEERKEANKFEMIILPASYNTYNDKDIIKELGFRFHGSYGWFMSIDVETIEEAKQKNKEVGAKARAKGLHGTFMINTTQFENIESPRHMQQILRENLDRALGDK